MKFDLEVFLTGFVRIMLCKIASVCQYVCLDLCVLNWTFLQYEWGVVNFSYDGNISLWVCEWAHCMHGPRVCAKHEDYIHTMPTDSSVSYLLNDFGVSADVSPQPLRPVLMYSLYTPG